MHAIAHPRTRHGYLAVPRSRVETATSPLEHGRLSVTSQWVQSSFMPSYVRARKTWGDNDQAIVSEIIEETLPQIPVRRFFTGPQYEIRRRIQLAVALLLNRDGIPVPHPPLPQTPRPTKLPSGPAWYRALVTGWAR